MAASTADAETAGVVLRGDIHYTDDTVLGVVDASGVRLTDVKIHSGTRIRIDGGHSLKIRARTLTLVGEGHVVIDGMGERGASGEPQSTELPAEMSPMACSDEAQQALMQSGIARGLPGNPGMPGGKGASVEIVADELRAPERVASGVVDLASFRSLFHVNVEGGEGGLGSEGGPGRRLQCGTDHSLSRQGPPGFSGSPGPRGPNGSFSLQGEPEPSPVGVALTISGGISMGSYEAGYNWALIRYIKSRGSQHRRPGAPPPLALVAVTGASAGSINTLLSAISYCQSEAVDRTESPFDNLFYEAWVPVGLGSLLPADSSQYQPTDAVLSRKAFGPIDETLMARVAKAENYVPGSCTLPIGLTVTRREPIELGGAGLEAPVDRFSIALEARAGDKGVTFHDLLVRDESAHAKPYLHLSPGEEPVDFPIVIKALRASSAFPVAFGMERVPFYREKDPAQPDSHEFWDGGLYDNIPIGLVLSFVQKPLYARPRFPGTVEVFAIDPDQRRIPAIKQAEMKTSTGPAHRGLSNLPRIASNVLSVARKYEVQNFIRFVLPQLNNCQANTQSERASGGGLRKGMGCINEPLVSSRYFPAYGQRFAAFGGFILESFRQFDFAAGIYDGLYSFAWAECMGSGEPARENKAKEVACLVQNFHRAYSDLGVTASGDAAYVVTALLHQELKEQFEMSGGEERAILSAISLPEGRDALTWLTRPPPHQKYFEVLLAQGQQSPSAEEGQGLEQDLHLVDRVMTALSEEDVRVELPKADQEFLDSGGSWYEPLISRALRRLNQIEVEEKNFLGEQITGTALLLLQTRMANMRLGLDLDPSSIPADQTGAAARVFHLLPYQLSGAVGRTVQAGWRPTLGVHPNVAFGLPLSVSLDWEGTHAPSRAAHAGAAIIGRTSNFFLTAAEMGPRITASSSQGFTMGAELGVYLLAGKLRLAAVVDNFGDFGVGQRDPLFITLGVADVNGLLYHVLF